MIPQTGYQRYQRYVNSLSRFYQRKKAKTTAGIVISILTVIFFLVFAIKPTLVTIASLMKQIKDQQSITEKLQNKINALSAAQTEYNVIEPRLYLIDQTLPHEGPQISILVKQIEALARQAGVAIGSVRFGQIYLKGKELPPKEEKTQADRPQAVSAINFSMTISGDYQNLKKFLNNLTSLRRVTIVESFTFSIGKTEEAQPLTLGLKGQAYYLKNDKKI